MSVLDRLAGALRDHRLDGLDPDSSEFLIRHQEILKTKPMMREIFVDFYRTIHAADEQHFTALGQRIEVGAGVSFMKTLYPDVIITDIKPAAHLDRVVDAQNLPYTSGSVRSVYAINCFHHFPDAKRFFSELSRALPDGGGAILIEPYYGPVARILYRHLFKSESFEMNQAEWLNQRNVTGVMTGANQALSYLIFVRDRKQFAALFPELEIVTTQLFNNYLRYLLSGGLNFIQLMPNWLLPAIRGLEAFLRPIQHIFALHYMIVIRKKTPSR